MLAQWGFDAGAVVLVVGLLVAARRDLRVREVPDSWWLVLGLAGAAIGSVVRADAPPWGFGLWLLVGGFTVQHFVPWDEALDRRVPNAAGWLELALYLLVGAVLVLVGWRSGVGPDGLPIEVIAVFATVLLARGLFEVGLLYGGADAKALMVAGVLVPLDASPLLAVPAKALPLLGVYPFSLTLLMDAALLAIAVPLAIAARNVRDREFEFPRGFTGYTIPVAELSKRFVWLKDPWWNSRHDDVEEAETTDEDIAIRRRQQADLERAGRTTVWVTPQIPFVVLMAGGALLGVVFGNVLFDLLALL